MCMRRIGLHIGFWLIFLLVNSYIEVTLATSSFRETSIWNRVWIGAGVELSTFPLKLVVAYLGMYYFIPKYFASQNYVRLIIEWSLLFLLSLCVYRVIVSQVIYPFIYQLPYQQQAFGVLFPYHLYTILDMASIVGITVSIKLVRMKIHSLKREKQLVEEKLQSELNFLKAQTNPHFLFNTLNNIYALARKKSDLTADTIMKLSKILRFMLYECNTDYISVSEEAKVIKDYIELEKLRYSNRLNIVYQEEIDNEHQLIAPLILLPFVENAFKHGVSETRFDSKVEIRLALQDQILDFEVLNTKDEMAEAINSEGIGLKNVQRQLALTYPEQYELQLRNIENKYWVKLKLKLL